jgi:hypothetical protein
MKKYILFVLLAILAGGCATVHLTQNCPMGSTGVGFALSGSTVGNTAISMLGGVATKAGFLMAQGPTPSNQASMDYTYVPIFGSDSGTLNCVIPPTQTVVVTSPPASVIHP